MQPKGVGLLAKVVVVVTCWWQWLHLQFIGTPHWMSPEVIQESRYDGKCYGDEMKNFLFMLKQGGMDGYWMRKFNTVPATIKKNTPTLTKKSGKTNVAAPYFLWRRSLTATDRSQERDTNVGGSGAGSERGGGSVKLRRRYKGVLGISSDRKGIVGLSYGGLYAYSDRLADQFSVNRVEPPGPVRFSTPSAYTTAYETTKQK
ncbi:hypothetical protein Ahy_A03g015062 [Arachis hypogaea]|uniref:Uncharacterized protein n=1 Tax=Arachis hypogaea TaxID=3818 RepID=A0A445DZD3_ARAHY|nr:hypothetical protein Ahy_A03g015062 [Arachis hypogaea]